MSGYYMTTNFSELPSNLPMPVDDGAAAQRVFGLRIQDMDYQREAHDRLHLPFQLLSDSSLQLKRALRLPTFTVGGMELYKRLMLIAHGGQIKKVFYPVFPPDRNADDVLAWLRARQEQPVHD
jgi:peroxiredoxin